MENPRFSRARNNSSTGARNRQQAYYPERSPHLSNTESSRDLDPSSMSGNVSVWHRFANSPFATAAAAAIVVLGGAWMMYTDVNDSIDKVRLEIKQDLKSQHDDTTRYAERSEDKAEGRLAKVEKDFDKLENRFNNLDAKLDRIFEAVKSK